MAGDTTRLVRIRIGLQSTDGISVFRADTLMSADDLAQLVPIVPEAGKSGHWAMNLYPDSPRGGQIILEILG